MSLRTRDIQNFSARSNLKSRYYFLPNENVASSATHDNSFWNAPSL
jgi:hypothetical protein